MADLRALILRAALGARRWCVAAGVLIVAAAAGCADEPSGTDGPVPECTGAVSVTVGTGTTPTFTWTPACRLFLLLVEPVVGGTDLWSIISDSANVIAPPVTYGVVPTGVQEGDPPTTLVVGSGYEVYLYRWTGPGRQDGALVGQATFTP